MLGRINKRILNPLYEQNDSLRSYSTKSPTNNIKKYYNRTQYLKIGTLYFNNNYIKMINKDNQRLRIILHPNDTYRNVYEFLMHNPDSCSYFGTDEYVLTFEDKENLEKWLKQDFDD